MRSRLKFNEKKSNHNHTLNFNYPRQPFRPTYHHNLNMNRSHPHSNHTNNNFNKQNSQQFLRGPINIQPCKLPPQTFLTNQQVFGTRTEQNHPTTMSTSTRNTFRNKPVSYFRQQSRSTYLHVRRII